VNLGIEYLARVGLLSEFLTIPCSLFLDVSRKTKTKSEKLVVTISNGGDNYIVKHWHISHCTIEEALPPMEEHYVKDFSNPNVIVPGYRLLKYNKNPYPGNKNTWRLPMPDSTYQKYHNQYFNADCHRLARDKWLFHSFLKIFLPNMFTFGETIRHGYFGTRIPAELITSRQKHEIERNFPKEWKYWKM